MIGEWIPVIGYIQNVNPGKNIVSVLHKTLNVFRGMIVKKYIRKRFCLEFKNKFHKCWNKSQKSFKIMGFWHFGMIRYSTSPWYLLFKIDLDIGFNFLNQKYLQATKFSFVLILVSLYALKVWKKNRFFSLFFFLL